MNSRYGLMVAVAAVFVAVVAFYAGKVAQAAQMCRGFNKLTADVEKIPTHDTVGRDQQTVALMLLHAIQKNCS